MHRILTAILFLVSGLLIYWFFNPEIYFFEILGLHNNNRIIIPSNNLFLFLKNYAADMLFCAAAFTCISTLLSSPLLNRSAVKRFAAGTLLKANKNRYSITTSAIKTRSNIFGKRKKPG